MKKLLLVGAFLLGSLLTANAQGSCIMSVNVPATDGVTTPYAVAALTGTYQTGCWDTTTATATAAAWYKITPAENGLVRVNTNLASNVAPNSVDTRFSVYTGTCGALTCYNGNDDVSGSNYLSDLTFEAEGGTTYYIVFDNKWSALGFNAEFTYTATSCFSASNFAYQDGYPTLTSVALSWDDPTIGSPEGYEVEYGPSGYTQGSGTALTLSDAEVTFDGLTSGTDYDFYIRTSCGDGDYSVWTGPITFTTLFEPADLDYGYSFEETNLGGWTVVAGGTTGSTWTRYANSDDIPSQEGSYFMAAGASGGVSNVWLFSRGLNATAGDVLTITYQVARVALDDTGAGGTNNLAVSIGTDATIAAQTAVLSPATAVTNSDYVQQTLTYTVPADGVYFLGFNYTAPAQSQASFGFLTLDNVQVDSALGLHTALNSGLSVFPNPAANVVNIANADNFLINGVKVTDMNGRVVKTIAYKNVSDAQVNISDLATGIYMMTITTDKGSVTKKIVKN